MENTPKLPRKSLSLTTRLRSRSNASPVSSSRNSLVPPSFISPGCNIDCTPPNRKCVSTPAYSPPDDLDFSPRSTLSHSLKNSPEVTWRWTQEDNDNDRTSSPSAVAKPNKNKSCVKELRKKRSLERKEEMRKVELEKRRAIRSKRDNVLKQHCEQMELLISKKSAEIFSAKNEKSPVLNKNRSLSNSSGYGSNNNVDNIVDLLNDSESDDLLLVATQQVEIKVEETKNKTVEDTTKKSKLSSESNQEKETRPVCEYLHDSLDDWFASLDADLLAVQPKKSRTSLQRYKSMPTNSPVIAKTSDSSKIQRYPSSSTLTSKTSFLNIPITILLERKLGENKEKIQSGNVKCFRTQRRHRGEH